ncbi:ankyrin repeat domain-containing protein, partial [Legionella norrlandica]|uniref:ankyrin repeat domain-containing protein n=1 Tax=Legionella norrlandica TaxID=1498499 RepID=UPI000569B206
MSLDAGFKSVISAPSISMSTIKEYLKNGANPNITNNNGETLLYIAAKNNWCTENYLELIHISLETKKLNANDFSTALGYYLSYASAIDLDIVKAFFDAGASRTKLIIKEVQFSILPQGITGAN